MFDMQCCDRLAPSSVTSTGALPPQSVCRPDRARHAHGHDSTHVNATQLLVVGGTGLISLQMVPSSNGAERQVYYYVHVRHVACVVQCVAASAEAPCSSYVGAPRSRPRAALS